ncbi:MAG: hypothetical protein Q9M08_01045 [Mariprofundus sp.]|nr:hypothetical protein [Mariprofundus sp.]
MNALIKIFAGLFLCMQVHVALAIENDGQVYDLGIESMRSHGYSVGIFIFLLISIVVFLFILVAFWKNSKGAQIKRGEKFLLGMIVAGVFIAIAFAAAQLLDGFLF